MEVRVQERSWVRKLQTARFDEQLTLTVANVHGCEAVAASNPTGRSSEGDGRRANAPLLVAIGCLAEIAGFGAATRPSRIYAGPWLAVTLAHRASKLLTVKRAADTERL